MEMRYSDPARTSHQYQERKFARMAILRTSRELYEEVMAYLYNNRIIETTIDSWPVWQVRPSWMLARRYSEDGSVDYLEDALPGSLQQYSGWWAERAYSINERQTLRNASSWKFSWYQRLNAVVVRLEPPTVAETNYETHDLGRDFELIHMHQKVRILVKILQREDHIKHLTVEVIDREGYVVMQLVCGKSLLPLCLGHRLSSASCASLSLLYA